MHGSFTIIDTISTLQFYGPIPGFHHGLDIHAPAGTPVYAPVGGLVGMGYYYPRAKVPYTYGVFIDGDDGFRWEFHHIDRGTIPEEIADLAKRRGRIEPGTLLARIYVGRAPNVEGLDLEKAGIAYKTREGVKVNKRLQTSNPIVYAAGDICYPYKFTHTADALARILIANALFMARQSATTLVIPWCTYTDPEVAHVGMYEKDARDKGIEVLTLTVPLSEVDRALLDGEAEGFARVHLKKGTDHILGATIVARHAGEMVNEFSLAITAGLGLSAIGKTIHPYPTQSEVNKKLADQYNRTRLTPFVKKLFAAWLKWQRQ